MGNRDEDCCIRWNNNNNLLFCSTLDKESDKIKGRINKIMVVDKDFLKIYWKLAYNSNEKKIKFLKVIFKCQDEFKGKKINYENIIPHKFKLISTFKEMTLDENKFQFQIIINWNREKGNKIKRHKIEYKFNINLLKILIDKNGINFEDDKKKIIIFFK